MDGLSLVETATGTWGPAALLAVATVMFFAGKIVAKPTVDKLLKGKDEALETQKNYYEGRISDINAAHAEQVTELRHSRDTISQALQGAVDNTTKLIAQNNELQEITRTLTPVVVSQRAVIEGATSNGD